MGGLECVGGQGCMGGLECVYVGGVWCVCVCVCVCGWNMGFLRGRNA